MTIQSCILFFSLLNNIDPNVTKAIIHVESSGNPFAKGTGDDYGLMQIRKKYVKYSKIQLMNSCTNIMVGTEILGKLKTKCKLCVAKVYVNSYNLGITGARKLRYPTLWKYHKKIVARLEE